MLDDQALPGGENEEGNHTLALTNNGPTGGVHYCCSVGITSCASAAVAPG